MIPSIEDILTMLVKGECTPDQALQWIGSHIDAATRDAALLDHFAATAEIARDKNGNLLRDSVRAVMGTPQPPEEMFYGDPFAAAAQRFQWYCDAEARMRYVKAGSMMKARIL